MTSTKMSSILKNLRRVNQESTVSMSSFVPSACYPTTISARFSSPFVLLTPSLSMRLVRFTSVTMSQSSTSIQAFEKPVSLVMTNNVSEQELSLQIIFELFLVPPFGQDDIPDNLPSIFEIQHLRGHALFLNTQCLFFSLFFFIYLSVCRSHATSDGKAYFRYCL